MPFENVHPTEKLATLFFRKNTRTDEPDFLSHSHAYFDPIDTATTTAAFFFTRWITDFYAPVFSLPAGTGAYISITRSTPPARAARTLVTRGFRLIFLELLILRVFWFFQLRLYLSQGRDNQVSRQVDDLSGRHGFS